MMFCAARIRSYHALKSMTGSRRSQCNSLCDFLSWPLGRPYATTRVIPGGASCTRAAASLQLWIWLPAGPWDVEGKLRKRGAWTCSD